MDVSIALEHRFHRTPDGAIWTQTMFPYAFWKRYLTAFDNVTIVARQEPVAKADTDWIRVDGPRVRAWPVPYYVGPRQYALRFNAVKRALQGCAALDSAYILRVPSMVATAFWKELRRRERPFGVEVVGDPRDIFAPGSSTHIARPFFRWFYTKNMKKQCGEAVAAAYVTSKALQQKYPASNASFTTYYSSVDLKSDAFVGEPRRWTEAPSPARLVTVGSLEHFQKGFDTLLAAIGICARKGMRLSLTIIGQGRHRGELEQIAAGEGVQGSVRFTGQLTAGTSVRQEFDDADLFVLPSRTEGLPRAMLEAMARGLPCIGTAVGGIPEILSESELVPPNGPEMLAKRIEALASSPERMTQLSKVNLARAKEYADSVLAGRRAQMYQFLHDQTARHSAKH